MFTEPFMQRALLAALFLAPLCGGLGVFVTARRMAFFSDTVSHAALAGVALGFWLGLANLTLPLVIVSLVIAGAIFWLKENTDLLTDTIMALLLSGSVAAGIMIISLLERPPRDIHSFLFGDILAIGWQEVWLAGALCVVVGSGLLARLTDLSLITLKEEMAQVSGLPVRRMNYIFIIALTLTVALSIRLLGILLVTALLVIPPAAARNLSCNLRQQLLLSVLAGFLAGIGGTLLSYVLNVPCGPNIVLTSIGLFLVSLIFGTFRRRKPGVVRRPL